MQFLRQSTASQEICLGYFVDSTDGNTEKTALTIANTDIKIWKTGATTLANKNSGGATHISNGIYYAVLDATDTDTIGSLRIFVHVSGALAAILNCVVLDEAVYDVLFGTTALSTLDAAGIRSAVGLATNNLDTQLTAIDDYLDTEIAAIKAKTDNLPALPAAVGDIPSAATIADAVWDEDATGHQTGGTFGQAIGDPGADTNTIFKAVVTDATGATVGVDAAAILADTGTDGVLLATGAIGASQFAAGAVDAAALAASAGEEIADTILLRKLDRSGNGTDATDERTVVNALRALRNKQSISAGTLTVTKENDLTTAWTAAVTTTASDPISAIDPT